MGILVSLAFIRAVELVELSLIVGSSLEEKSKLLFSNVDSVSYLWVTEVNWEKKKSYLSAKGISVIKAIPQLDALLILAISQLSCSFNCL